MTYLITMASIRREISGIFHQNRILHNRTNAGVDVILIKMCKKHSTRNRTLHWPMVHFQNILDVTAINTCTIFAISHPESLEGNRRGRRYMLLDLAKDLCRDYVVQRLEFTTGGRSADVTFMKKILGIEDPRAPPQRA